MSLIQVVDRVTWKASPPKRPYHKIKLFQPKLILHHTAGALLHPDDYVSLNDLRRIKGIQTFHQDTRGWNDIAYSYLADPDGFLFEGRGPGVANGATFGHGASSYAICVMGHYDKQKPTSRLLEQLAATVVWGHAHGYWPLGFTGGHRDYGSTSCPGSNLYPLIKNINKRAQEIEMARFTDVPPDHTHYNAIEWLADQGITAGTNPPENDKFSPDRAMTRAEFATMMKRYDNLRR